jgi:DNA-binding MarR family transcriptional regulator
MLPEQPIHADNAECAWKQAIGSILITGYMISDRLNELLKPFGISEQQLNVLFILKKQPGHTCNLFEVQGQMMHKMSNATRLVEKLRLKGLLTRDTGKDNRRTVDITITKKGLAFLEKVEGTLKKCHHPLYESKLCAEEFKHLVDLLDKFRK